MMIIIRKVYAMEINFYIHDWILNKEDRSVYTKPNVCNNLCQPILLARFNQGNAKTLYLGCNR